MIVNLVGPPCGGKSTFAARFVLEHSKFRYCPIDEYRIEYQDETKAWHEMTKDVLARRHVLIESCGLNWRLAVLLNSGIVKRRPLITVAFNGEYALLIKRLQERHKRPLPDPFRPQDEYAAVSHVIENLHHGSVAGLDFEVYTTDKTEEEVYHEVCSVIHRELLFRSGRQSTRPDFQVIRSKGARHLQRAKQL